MIKILIADDSATALALLHQVFTSDPEIEVVGTVRDGLQAVEFVNRERPDVVSMDIHMPNMNGLEATRRIMETAPVPVVIVSGLAEAEQRASFEAFEAGALAVVSRPPGPGHEMHEEAVQNLLRVVKVMAEVRQVRRWPKPEEHQGAPPGEGRPIHQRVRLVGMGASTGGPGVFKTILEGLPADFPLPILVVQHMSRGFIRGFVDWLGTSTEMAVRLAQQGEGVNPGHVYVAPEGRHMGVTRSGRIQLSESEDGTGLRPSVAWLFQSLAREHGSAAMGVLLTGMGRDGADSLKLMNERGAITVVQDAASCIVNGMPQEALKLGAADHVLSPARIRELLQELASGRLGSPRE